MNVDVSLTRRIGQLIETVHAVVYFAPEALNAYEQLGLKGYWRGYFASRTAALGPVSAPLATALLGGFATTMVARALPAVWATTSPEQVLTARLRGATSALTRLIADDRHAIDDALITEAAALTRACCLGLPAAGRPMAAALSALPVPAETLASLWFNCTILREFRGDGHLMAVAAYGLDWPVPHLMQGQRVDSRQQEYRGWDDEAWNHAKEVAVGKHLTDVDNLTDTMTEPAYRPLAHDQQARLVELLVPLAAAASRQLPYPNAMGLVRPDESST